jgi:hypothetical protein
MTHPSFLLLASSLALCAACSDGDETTWSGGAGGGGGGTPTCEPGTTLVGNDCLASGVPEGECALGFEHDGRGGCIPVLPAAICPAGEMAVPGETNCREVAPCGPAPWGDVPVGANTQYVDGSYIDGDSDGTAAKPWSNIQEGVNAAEDGAVVAIAEGVYSQPVSSFGRVVALWGRCPALVTLQSATAEAPISINDSGFEVHTLAIQGTDLGVFVFDSEDVVLDRLWIHDTGAEGVFVASIGEPTSATLTGSLLENNASVGMVTLSARVDVDGSVIRRALQQGTMQGGRGINAEDGDDGPSDVRLTSSVLEAHAEYAVGLFGSRATLNGTVVRDTTGQLTGRWGLGIAAQIGATGSELDVDQSVLSGNRMFGISVIGSRATIARTTITNTLPQASDEGFGDAVVSLDSDGSGQLTIETSKLAGAARAGIATFSADVSLATTALECNSISLNGEAPFGPFNFDNAGGNACWCDQLAEECRVDSSALAPPPVVP